MYVVVEFIHEVYYVVSLILIKCSEEIGCELMIAFIPSCFSLLHEVLAWDILYILAVYLVTHVHDKERHQWQCIVFSLAKCSFPVLIGQIGVNNISLGHG